MNRTAEAYPKLNKLPLKGLGCRVEGRGMGDPVSVPP
jgi:hypothetical protein